MKILTGSLLAIILAISGLTYLALENAQYAADNLNMIKKSDFDRYLFRFGLQFKDPVEYQYRLKVFSQNQWEIEKHNSDPAKTFSEGLTQFTYLTSDEFVELYLNYQSNDNTNNNANVQQFSNDPIPDTFNWKNNGAVTPVKNQGQCGSCYSFSSTGALEGLNFIDNHVLVSFSEQQIIDCTYSYGNNGCKGGLMTNSFNFVRDHGITTGLAYPYEEQANLTCKQDSGAYKIAGYKQVAKGSCQDLEKAIYQQPISVAVDARNLQNYISGVISYCGEKVTLNHAVLAVGYTPNYFIIKNSWGTSFGENGYFRLSKNNTCGVCQDASFPVV